MESSKLAVDFTQVDDKITKICQNIIKKNIDLQQEEVTQKLEEHQKHLQSISNAPLVKLNVGGKKFTTSLATLTSVPDSALAKMFTDNNNKTNLQKDGKGYYFIDRNGEYFAYILDLLRDNSVALPTDSFLGKKIKEEMEHFKITIKPKVPLSIQGAWSWDPLKQAGVTLSNNNLTVTKVGSAGSGITYANVLLETGVYRWKVKVTNVANSYWVGAGIVNENEIPFSPSFSYTNCWGISSYGNIYRMTGSGINVKITTGDVYVMEYNATTTEFKLEVPGKGINLTALVPNSGAKLRPYGYVWTVGDCLTLEFD